MRLRGVGNVSGSPTWLDDGTFLWRSERTGWAHLYHLDRDGNVLHTVTGGEWEVRVVHGVDEEAGIAISPVPSGVRSASTPTGSVSTGPACAACRKRQARTRPGSIRGSRGISTPGVTS